MEQITKKGGDYFYGDRICPNVDDAYKLFRDDYHRLLGKRVYRRLNRIGQREERIHGFGFVFDVKRKYDGPFHNRVDTRLLGLVCGSYCRILGEWDLPEGIGVDGFEDWFDWAFSAGSGALRLVGRKGGGGRTSKIQKKRYR